MVHRFRATRWSPGNRLFPTVLEVSDRHVTRIKTSWMRHLEESISIRQVSSVTIARGALWSEIVVHSSGGTDPLRSHGHANADAERLKELIEEYQTNIARTGVADTSDLRACPAVRGVGEGGGARVPLLRRHVADRAYRGGRGDRRARRRWRDWTLELDSGRRC